MNPIKHILILAFSCFLLRGNCFAQVESQKLVREGNKKYNEKKYSDAEKNYQKAISKQANSYSATFNLGDSYYKQGKYKEATEQFESLSGRKTSDDTLAKVFHNLGNSYLKQKEYEKAINSYENALKKNDKDDETRYNLAYSQKMLQQKKNQQKQNKNDKDKKNDKKQDKKQNKDQDKKKDDKKDKQQQKQQQEKQNISKEDAQRLLDAMNNDEKKLRDKMNEKKAQVSNKQIEKDW